MSEKRLDYVILMNNYYQIIEKDDDGHCRRLAPTKIIDLLNELKKENEELKHRIILFEQQEDEFKQCTVRKYDSKLQR